MQFIAIRKRKAMLDNYNASYDESVSDLPRVKVNHMEAMGKLV